MAMTTERSRKTERLGDVLAQFRVGTEAYDPVQDAPLETLREIQPTDQILVRRDALVAALAEPAPTEGDGHREIAEHRRRLGIRLGLVDIELKRAQRRDALQAARPAGCECLGLGGWGQAIVAYSYGSPLAGNSAQVPVFGPDGEPLQGWRKYCECPDGQAQLAATTAARQRSASEHRARQQASLWDGIGIPSRFSAATLESFLERSPGSSSTVERLSRWLGSDHWLVLWGPVGRGKTGVAAALVRRLVEQGQGVLFRAVPDLLDRLRATYGGEGREHELMAALFDVDVLVLDDVGAERQTDWALERVFRVINHRYDERRRTMLTTNLDPDALHTHLGVRNFDRLREMATPSGFVKLDGPNLRDLAW